jgi:uncharacterized protein YicC (UPF0701 family)
MNPNAINWDMWAFVSGLATLLFAILAYLFSPIKQYFEFLREITKKGGIYNYMEMHGVVQVLHEAHKENNSPLVKELQAKIQKLEEEKERRGNEYMQKLEGTLNEIRKEMQEVKMTCQR